MSSSVNEQVRIDVLRSEVFQILQSLLVLEYQESRLDNRCYTTMDILDALSVTEHVIVARLTDYADEWKNDYKHNFNAIFSSIRDQVKETVALMFCDRNGKSQRFVHTFNTLLIERFFMLIQAMGPTGALDMVPLMIMELTAYITNLDEEQQQDIVTARMNIDKLRKMPQKQSLTPEQRLEFIRQLAQEAA